MSLFPAKLLKQVVAVNAAIVAELTEEESGSCQRKIRKPKADTALTLT